MHKRGLCVVRCLSVCLSVTFVYSVEASKHKIFHHRAATPFYFFGKQTSWQYSDRRPPNWGGEKIAIFDQYMALESMTAGASTFRRRSKVITLMRLHLFIAQTKGHASVNLVYDSKPGLVRRREHNRISLYALVNLKPKYRN